MATTTENDVPACFWQFLQWHTAVNTGSTSAAYRTLPHRHPPTICCIGLSLGDEHRHSSEECQRDEILEPCTTWFGEEFKEITPNRFGSGHAFRKSFQQASGRGCTSTGLRRVFRGNPPEVARPLDRCSEGEMRARAVAGYQLRSDVAAGAGLVVDHKALRATSRSTLEHARHHVDARACRKANVEIDRLVRPILRVGHCGLQQKERRTAAPARHEGLQRAQMDCSAFAMRSSQSSTRAASRAGDSTGQTWSARSSTAKVARG